MTNRFDLTVHDALPREEAGLVDQGLGESNEAAAPLHEVQPLSCFARDAQGHVVGGAIGRTWGDCCELQQLWVDPRQRHHGLGSRIMHTFEKRAMERGCKLVYLDTFSFQARPFYERLGYVVALEIAGFSPGVVKYTMTHRLPAEAGMVP